MTRKGVLIAAVVGVLALGVAGADALGLFGVIKRDFRDVVHVQFRAVEAESGRAVGPVYVNCSRRGQPSACSARPGANEELVDVNIASRRVVERSRLFRFKRAEYDTSGEDLPLYIVFIHPDYERTTGHYTLGKLRALQDSVQRVPMRRPSE